MKLTDINEGDHVQVTLSFTRPAVVRRVDKVAKKVTVAFTDVDYASYLDTQISDRGEYTHATVQPNKITPA